jgi:hypothetical protein
MSRSDNFDSVNSIGNGEVDSSILSGSTIFFGFPVSWRFPAPASTRRSGSG